MIVVSSWAKPGHVSHTYTDHVSVLKFIERNWKLPANRPAVGDMFDYFDFKHADTKGAPPNRRTSPGERCPPHQR